jgi:hypothetical protein
MSATPFPCPCCGYLVFAEPPGSSDICMICFWEDDAEQLRYPDLADETNIMSLVEAQRSYGQHGAVDERLKEDVRRPTAEDVLDRGFRPIDPQRDSFEPEPSGTPGPADLTALYYWRPTFWRTGVSNT